MSITPRMALSLALAANELGTNALKYGALSVPNGRVQVSWSVADGSLIWAWEELDGPTVQPPSKKGFGSVLIEQVFSNDFAGQVTLVYSGGFACRLVAPVPEPNTGNHPRLPG